MILVFIKHLKNYLEIFITKKTTIQDEITGVMGALKAYAPRDNKYVEAKNKLVNNVENFYKGIETIIEEFKNGIFPVYYDERHEHQMKAQREIEKEEEFLKYIENESKDIGYISFSYYFNFVKSSDLTKKLFEIKNKKKVMIL